MGLEVATAQAQAQTATVEISQVPQRAEAAMQGVAPAEPAWRTAVPTERVAQQIQEQRAEGAEQPVQAERVVRVELLSWTTGPGEAWTIPEWGH